MPIKLIGLIVAVPLVLIVRLIRPWVLIRFGYFFAGRIGHFAFDVEYYMTEKKLGLHPEKAIDLFFYMGTKRGKTSNEFFSKLTKRSVKIVPFTKNLYFMNNLLPGGKIHQVLPAVKRFGSRDIKGLFRKTDTQLQFNEVENDQGISFLESVGMGKNDKFVCLMVRDSAYLANDTLHNRGGWDYHNYRDSDIDTYEQAALALAEKGYWVFRMGKVVHKKFKVDHHYIIDYANSEFRSDFLDIWLMANCFYCVSAQTGLDEVSRIFRKPALNINCLPLSHLVSYSHCITVPKHLVWMETNRQLNLNEYLVNSYLRTQEYENAKIKIIDLSTKEIIEAVLEMESILNGTWQNTDEDQQLQDRFWDIFKSQRSFSKYNQFIHPDARIGAKFLKKNITLLD